MYKDIDMTMADGEVLSMPFEANAATPIRFKQIFGRDVWHLFKDAEEDENTIYENMDTFSELAYVMHCQGSGADMTKQNFDSYVSWLEQLDGMAIIRNIIEIMGLYYSTMRTANATGKKTDGKAPEK